MTPTVTIHMANGDVIHAELYPDIAPDTVANFVELALGGVYDGTVFHRVIPGFMAQGGDPDGSGAGGPGWSIRGEFAANGHPNDLRHTRGVLSMARARHMDSAGSQFFIMVSDAPHLDGQYAAFGRVTDGMEAVDRIVSAPVEDMATNRPVNPPVMKRVTVDAGDVKYLVNKLTGIR